MNMYIDAEADDDEQDSLKEMLLETNPYLIAATVIVSVLHSVFELLAFKNGEELNLSGTLSPLFIEIRMSLGRKSDFTFFF